MSNCANVYRINFDTLRRIRGSKDGRLLKALIDAYPDEDRDYDDDDAVRRPTLASAFATIINGESATNWFFGVYAIASDLIYGHFGVMLNANAISPSSASFLAEIDYAFECAELSDCFPIFNSVRAPPLLSKSPHPPPSLSHMTPREVVAAWGIVQTRDWTSWSTDVQEAIAMVDGWINEAVTHGEGLVCFYG